MVYNLIFTGDYTRVRTKALLKNYEGIVCNAKNIVDTGNPNTTVPLSFAQKVGIAMVNPLTDSHTSTAKLAGKTHTTYLYRIPFIEFSGKLIITDVAVDAIDFRKDTELRDSIVLGLNVMNNWDYRINRGKDIFEVKEDIFPFSSSNKLPYMNYFDLIHRRYTLLRDVK